ncbi:E3 ubiquitin-protein ligase XIAP-like isoform X1 [Mercenaria mercenaria]|uniref:E3 ubiquitin-protein ligase XIAP-like isoform X1 n=1 Tax=Mercenaria mercenaria TaxID=6596 RepID=UPI00234F171E|nr:E3 ubiquitin-protein ligase XIAP-like isoform X1 [Mercenaria mercenaria]XP_053385503.1 E3 ubiquitin-protein ligase XIAP-like isoform X1 [Mercenaria mercenaria]
MTADSSMIPEYPNYITQESRLASFNTPGWRRTYKPKAVQFAEYGFFFTGIRDLVRCYQCAVGLEGWVIGNDVLIIHVENSPSCNFLGQKFGHNEIDRFKLALAFDDRLERHLPYQIWSPRYQTMKARVASFFNCPQFNDISHHELAAAGLHFTGRGNECRCFTCDGGFRNLRSWHDLFEEHRNIFSGCPYINQLRGSTYYIACLYHVLRPLGFAKAEVMTGKDVLARKGNKFPSAEEIANLLLDKIDYKKVVGMYTTKLVEELSPNQLLDKFLECGYFTYLECRDMYRF